MQWCVQDIGKESFETCVTLPCSLCEGPLNYISLHVLSLHESDVQDWRRRFYLQQYVHIYILCVFTEYAYMRICLCVHKFVDSLCQAHIMLRCLILSHLFCPACCFPFEPRCASALLQLYGTFHSNLREWELKARWTYLNNEGILCLQYSIWLTQAVWAQLQFKGRQTLIIFHQVLLRSWATQVF